MPQCVCTVSGQKKSISSHWGGTISKGMNMYHLGTNMHTLVNTNTHPLWVNRCTFWKGTTSLTVLIVFYECRRVQIQSFKTKGGFIRDLNIIFGSGCYYRPCLHMVLTSTLSNDHKCQPRHITGINTLCHTTILRIFCNVFILVQWLISRWSSLPKKPLGRIRDCTTNAK